MTKIYEFDPVLYPFPLLVTKEFDSKDLADMFYCVNDKDELEDAPEEFQPNHRCIARTVCVVSKKSHLRYVIVMLVKRQLCGVGTMAHEAGHYASMIADFCGFLPDKCENDEPLQYLTQWAANCIHAVKTGHVEYMNGKEFEG